jgi:hypothetical protein
MKSAIEIQLMGGLGNQLHGLAAGWAMAGYLDSNLIVDATRIPFSSNVSRRFELGAIELNMKNRELIFCNTTPQYLHNIRERALRKLRVSHRKKLDQLSVDYWDSRGSIGSQLGSIKEKDRICGEFIDFEWAEKAKESGFPTALKIIEQKPALIGALRRIDQISIAVHVRLGDYLTHNDIFESVPEKYYLDSLLESNYRNASRITLFSDTPKLVESRYPELFRIITDVESNVWTSVETMSLMSRYSTIITANSTFSSWAAWFGQDHSAKVFTPIPHLRNNWVDKLPREWARFSINDNHLL